ncbi:YihY/virulence factor BrkB family protein [Phenylobacterium sp.]|uniref:YihY/virulence factor BrkB family protein n=1 Tax=Phenylobacterium sp. TaxID=1871053 RepID=UPI0025D4B98F|nr:YihY/virulence factor BrkB family protein [Phenylobacterium sp.]
MTIRQSPTPSPTGFRFDRWSALGIGMLLGLATVFVDGRLQAARPPSSVQPADTLGEVSRRSWRLIVQRTFTEFNQDRIPAVAAGSAFYALLALFPALAVFVSLYGLVGDLAGAQNQIASLHGILPEGGVSVLSDQIARLAATSHASLGLTFFVSLLLSVWTSNAGMKGLIGGLNVAYECRERRNFVVLNLISLGFTAAAILFSTAAMAAVVAAPEVLASFHLEALRGASLARWPAMFVVAVGGLSLLYRFAPSRPRARWRWITPGGVLAAACWMAMSVGFSFYVGHFGHYDRTYGSLGAIVGFMTWIWLSLTIALLGAEFNSELEEQVGAEP